MEGNQSTAYQYTLEAIPRLDSGLKNLTSLQMDKMVQEENARNVAMSLKMELQNGVVKEEKEYDSMKYSYILEPENGMIDFANRFGGKNFNVDVKKEKMTGDIDYDEDDEEDKLVIDLSMGTAKCGTEDITPIKGASKRKRSNMNNVLSTILHDKTSPTERVNSDTCEATDLSLRVNEAQTSEEDSEEDAQPVKMVITDKLENSSEIGARSVSPISATEILKRAASSYHMNTHVSPIPFSPFPANLSSNTAVTLSQHGLVSTPKIQNSSSYSTPPNSFSGSGRKNRRKKYVPIKCEKLDVNDEDEYVEEYSSKRMRSDVVKSEVLDCSPLDLSSSSKQTFETDSPMDLSARSSPEQKVKPVQNGMSFEPVNLTNGAFPKNERKEFTPLNLKIPAVTQPGFSPSGFLPNPLLAGMSTPQLKNFYEMMMKKQPQFPSPNLMQTNTQLMQFHALMQSAMLNNSYMAMKNLNNNVTPVTNDKNDNLVKVKQETPDIKQEIRSPYRVPEFPNSALDYFSKSGMMPSPFMAGFKGFPTGMPFLPPSPLLDPKPTPGRRKKGRESSVGQVVDRTVIPSLDDIPALRSHISTASPDAIIDTLKKLFPIQPPVTDTEAEYGTEDNPMKFLVKDNEQIQTIVDSLLVCCEIVPGEFEKYSGEYRNVCRMCNSAFFHIEHLTKHVKKDHIVKRFQCNQCERSFHDAGNFRQHMRVHDESDIPFECHTCQRRFRHKCTLKVHMRIHTGEKPFKCEVCGATFKISSGLQTHMRKHTGETPYACEFCSMRFKCQSNLKQHLFQHTQRPFSCEVCGKSYSRKSIRDSHMLTHAKDFAASMVGKMDINAMANLSPMSSSQFPSLSPIPSDHMPSFSPVSSGQDHTDMSVDSLGEVSLDESEGSSNGGHSTGDVDYPPPAIINGQAVMVCPPMIKS
ncbi:uncharacterized protein LOC128240160 isoform X2 [Mya arenaria]|uniref:uncharacterized protein LOC128240160 isoform X2 n=1 Tax=Mya arenaria TaxID=6604 RepID=UPI0022E2FE44|nr:uncharacterized protein LOC128240160 isoform X2 [Mya arenaria]